MTLCYCAGERSIERIHREGFSGDEVVLLAYPDMRHVWTFHKGEEAAAMQLEIPDEIAQRYADEGGRTFRIPAHVVNEYLERPGPVKGAGG